MKILKRRTGESSYTEEEFRTRYIAYEELATDVLAKEVSDKVKAALRVGKYATLEAAIAAIEKTR